MATSPGRERVEALAGLGTWTLDLGTGQLVGNRTVRTLLDWPEGDADPTLADYFDAVHPDDRAELERHWQQLRREGTEYDLEHRLLLHGAVKHMRAVACADRDEQGQVRLLHGITQDVTARRTAELATERERDRSRAVLSSLAEGCLLAQDGAIVEVNEALCRMTGFSRDRLVGSGTPYPFWPRPADPGLAALRVQLADGRTASSRTEIVRADGSTLPVAVTVTSLDDDEHAQVWVVVVRDITEQRENERRLEARAAADPLTGVLNSRAFREELAVACGEPRDAPVTLALLDLDHFKTINDQYGHAVGDQVLIAVVERLRAATAGVGSLARVGGEEFALLMRHTDEDTGRAVVAGALDTLRSVPLPVVGRVTASAGVAELRADLDDDTLYRLADRRLYDAKAQGRDQVR